MGVNGFTGSGSGGFICCEELVVVLWGYDKGPLWLAPVFGAGPAPCKSAMRTNGSIACVAPVQGSIPHVGVTLLLAV